jgi:transglutaminase-like putative cysteine protease
MSRLPPEAWGDAATTWPDRFFQIRVNNESDPDRLRAAAAAEANRSDTRPERIARINKRLTTIQQ